MVHDREIRAPGSDRFAVLFGHHARRLRNVTEVVGHPGRQQLTERHCSKGRMLTFERELRVSQLPTSERREVFGADAREFVEQVGE